MPYINYESALGKNYFTEECVIQFLCRRSGSSKEVQFYIKKRSKDDESYEMKPSAEIFRTFMTQ